MRQRGNLWFIVLLLVALVCGCRGESATVRDGETRPLFAVEVLDPGKRATELSTGAALPMAIVLGRADGVDVAVTASRKGAAVVFVHAEDAATVEAQLDAVAGALPEQTPRPVVTPWRERREDAGRVVVTVEQVALERAGLSWPQLEAAVADAAAAGPVSLDALAATEVGDVTLGSLGTLSERPSTADQVVVRLEATTHDVLREQMDALSGVLTEALGVPNEVSIEVSPPLETALEVRLRPQVMLAQKVHFPEVQTAISRFGRQRRVFDEGDARVVELVLEPAPMQDAAQTEVESKWGNVSTLASLAEVSVVNRPVAYLRGPEGQFVGFLLVRGAPTSTVAVAVGTRGAAAVEGLRAEVLGRRSRLEAPASAQLSWPEAPRAD